MTEEVKMLMTEMELRASIMLGVAYSTMIVLTAKPGDDPIKIRESIENEVEKIIKIMKERHRE